MCYIINMISGVYKITNTINGKFYIGSSYDIEGRWDCHKKCLKGNYHNNPKLQHAWNKYGQNAFIFEILEFTNILRYMSVKLYTCIVIHYLFKSY